MSNHSSSPLQDPIKEKLVGYLAAGVSQAAAAQAVGVDASYVSQLLQDPEFKQALLDASTGRIEKAIEHDGKIEAVEVKALKVVEQKLPYVRSAAEAAKVFATLNTARRRSVQGDGAPANAGAQIVTLILPKASSAVLKLNSTNQVIEVEGRTMATLPSRALPALSDQVREFKQKQEARDLEVAQEKLEELTPMMTRIGGVMRVL